MSFLLAHLSDLHLGPLPDFRRRALLSKRITGFINWKRNRGAGKSPDALNLLIDHLRKQKPDHIAVTGDIVNLALREEWPLAKEFMQKLGSPDHVSFVPGNHDAYVPGAYQKMLQWLMPYMLGIGQTRVNFNFPWTRQIGFVRLIGISTAYASAPFMATGRIGTSQLKRLEAMLARDAQHPHGVTVLLIHHPPFLEATKWHKRLTDIKALQKVIHRYPVDLILHGHNHTQSYAAMPTRSKPVPIIGVQSASLHKKHYKPGYFLYKIGEQAPVCIKKVSACLETHSIEESGWLSLKEFQAST